MTFNAFLSFILIVHICSFELVSLLLRVTWLVLDTGCILKDCADRIVDSNWGKTVFISFQSILPIIRFLFIRVCLGADDELFVSEWSAPFNFANI